MGDPEPDGPAYIEPPTPPRFAGGRWSDEPAPPPAEPVPEKINYLVDANGKWRTRRITIGATYTGEAR